jgi:hypothetical protein
MWLHCNNQEVFCWQREFALDTEEWPDSQRMCCCNVGTSFDDDAFAPTPSSQWVSKGQSMSRHAKRAALALCATASFVPACAAACSEHTFDACPEPQPGYHLEVDRKTGRTWLKENRAPAANTSTLGRLSAAARKLPVGSMERAAAAEQTGAWETQVKPQTQARPLK